MSLVYITSGDPWDGAPINDIRHPPNIEAIWSDAELAAIGLQRPVPPEPHLLSLAEAKEQKINEAWLISQQRFAESTVSVTVNGALRTYGCDPITRENVTAINTAISRAPHLVPNPRPYTPKGGSPVMTTHEEFLAIYLAGLAKGDAFYQAYYAHKIAILAMGTVEEVLGHEVAKGWPV